MVVVTKRMLVQRSWAVLPSLPSCGLTLSQHYDQQAQCSQHQRRRHFNYCVPPSQADHAALEAPAYEHVQGPGHLQIQGHRHPLQVPTLYCV